MPKDLDETKLINDRELNTEPRNGSIGRWQRRRHGRRANHRSQWRGGTRSCGAVTPGALTEVHPGDDVEVVEVMGDEVFRGRLMALGILPGTRLSVVSGGPRGPLVLAMAGGKFVFDRNSARRVLVRVCSCANSPVLLYDQGR